MTFSTTMGPQPDLDSTARLDACVVAAIGGDAAAFAAVYEHFARRVYAYCLARVRRAADAEDLTQLTFLKVVEALPRYEPRGLPFAAWLFRLAHNVVIDHFRERREHLALDDLHREVGEPPHWMVASGRDDDLAAALPMLTPDQREVIAARFFAGLSVRETAALLCRDERAVRALQHRGIGALRRRLAPPPGRVTSPAIRTGSARPWPSAVES